MHLVGADYFVFLDTLEKYASLHDKLRWLRKRKRLIFLMIHSIIDEVIFPVCWFWNTIPQWILPYVPTCSLLGTDNHLGPSETAGNEPVRNLLLCGRRISLPSFKKAHGFDSIYVFSLSFMITANQQAQTHFSSLI